MVLKLFDSQSKQDLREGCISYAVGGGKGGIGKSFITSNLASYLARLGYKTLLVDLDFGGANAHTYLNVSGQGVSAKNFLIGQVSHLGEVVVETGFKNLSMIRGASDWDEVLTLDEKSIRQLMSAAVDIGFDRIVYDLGAGTGVETLEAFLGSDIQIAVSTPEPISIENTYNFLKRCFYKKLQMAAYQVQFQDSLNIILSKKAVLGIKKPADLLGYLEKNYPGNGSEIVKLIKSSTPKVLINQCRSPRDAKIGKSLAHISRQYFGQQIECVGSLDFDNRVWQSIRSMKPLFIEFPESETLQGFKKVFAKLEEEFEPNNKLEVA